MIVIEHVDATDDHLHRINKLIQPHNQVQLVKDLDSVTHLEQTEVLFTYGKGLTAETLKKMPALKWIQLSATGFDHLPAEYIQENYIQVTTVKGSHSVPIAEYALSCMLYFARNMEHFFYLQDKKMWDRTTYPGELFSKKLVILGTGHIGKEIARKAKAFDMKTIGVNRRGQGEAHFDEVYPIDQLDMVLPMAEYLILAIPYTKETYQLIGDRELALLSSGTVLINVGRGELMDEEGAQRAIEEGRLKGMALDVFHQEPLPFESALWNIPKLMITPHMAAKTDCFLDRCMDIFADNCKLFLEKKPLNYLAEFSRGY